MSRVGSERERPLDHTLPVSWLWPLTTENATLLCASCNGKKSGTWPGAFYPKGKIRELSVITGFPVKLLQGDPHFNPDALTLLEQPEKMEKLLISQAHRMLAVVRLRNRILNEAKVDIFANVESLSQTWVDTANSERNQVDDRAA